MSRFVRPETVQLQLADVARRAYEAQRTAHQALVARVPPAHADDVAQSETLLARAAQRAADAAEEGAWLLVKKRLNNGETRAAYTRMYNAGVDGSLKVNPLQTGMAVITAYLIDWSLTDDDGEPVEIRNQPLDVLEAALDAMDPDSFTEIKEAIEAHDTAMATARADAKKNRDGTPPFAPTSPSPSAAAGASNGFESLMTTSGTS